MGRTSTISRSVRLRLGAGDDAVLGVAAAHQAIVGDRLRLALDAVLCTAVTGVPGPLAHPALVCDVAIGHSTLATRRVKANLSTAALRSTGSPSSATPTTPKPKRLGYGLIR